MIEGDSESDDEEIPQRPNDPYAYNNNGSSDSQESVPMIQALTNYVYSLLGLNEEKPASFYNRKRFLQPTNKQYKKNNSLADGTWVEVDYFKDEFYAAAYAKK